MEEIREEDGKGAATATAGGVDEAALEAEAAAIAAEAAAAPVPAAGSPLPAEAPPPAPEAANLSGLDRLVRQYPNLEKVFQLELPVIVVLAEKSSTLEEVLALSEGSVIVFKKHNSEPIDILIHNKKIGAGKTIKVGERFGILVREVGTPQETLQKLR